MKIFTDTTENNMKPIIYFIGLILFMSADVSAYTYSDDDNLLLITTTIVENSSKVNGATVTFRRIMQGISLAGNPYTFEEWNQLNCDTQVIRSRSKNPSDVGGWGDYDDWGGIRGIDPRTTSFVCEVLRYQEDGDEKEPPVTENTTPVEYWKPGDPV